MPYTLKAKREEKTIDIAVNCTNLKYRQAHRDSHQERLIVSWLNVQRYRSESLHRVSFHFDRVSVVNTYPVQYHFPAYPVSFS